MQRYEIVNGLAEVEGADIDEPEGILTRNLPHFYYFDSPL